MMENGIHKVVLYFDDELKQFTVAARMERARLPGVDEQMAGHGFTRRVIAERLGKEQAETLRDQVRDEWTAKGYAYQTRDPLS